MPSKTVAFFMLEIVVLGVFAIGLIGSVAFWLQGSAGGRRLPFWDKAWHVLGRVKLIFHGATLREFLLDWLLQRRLLAAGRLRWLMHICFFWSFIILFFVGSVGLMLAERGLLPITKDDPWFAFVNDFAGAMALFAVAIALYCRFILKENVVKTFAEDIVLVVLLAVIVLSGYALESARLIAHQAPGHVARYSFVGYPLSLALRGASLDWWGAESAIWWVHVVGGMSFVAYLPYSKMFHLIATPFALAANTVEARKREYVTQQRHKDTERPRNVVLDG